MHVVDEAPAAVDLHDGDPLPVRSLEVGVAVDRDLAELEAQLFVRLGDYAAGRLAKVATRGRIQDDVDAQRTSSSRARTE
jgi:hypothetical protein